jgi:hypothetical protein
MPGKILVYPSMKGMKLTALPDLTKDVPLTDGHWTIEAEKALLKT